jgi:hypothetical protein
MHKELISPSSQRKKAILQSCKGRLLNQNTSAKGDIFEFRNALYVDDSMFLFNTRNELDKAPSKRQKHFTHFGLIMHVRDSKPKSKSENIYFPP